jgi:hypothetical protein
MTKLSFKGADIKGEPRDFAWKDGWLEGDAVAVGYILAIERRWSKARVHVGPPTGPFICAKFLARGPWWAERFIEQALEFRVGEVTREGPVEPPPEFESVPGRVY